MNNPRLTKQVERRCDRLTRLGLTDQRVQLLQAAVRTMAELFPQLLVDQVILGHRSVRSAFCQAIRRQLPAPAPRSDWLIPPVEDAATSDAELLRTIAEHQDTGLASIWEPQRRSHAA